MFKRNKMRSILAVGLVTGTLITGSKFATARNVEDYNMIIPRIGGNAYSTPVEKTNASNGVNNNTSVGGNKTIYSTICYGTKNITNETKTTPGSRVVLKYRTDQNIKGRNHRLMLETGVTDLVQVQAQGSWSPDIDD